MGFISFCARYSECADFEIVKGCVPMHFVDPLER